jgi:hypothetical protein
MCCLTSGCRRGEVLLPEEPKRVDAVMRSLTLALSGEPNLWHVRAFRVLTWLRDQEQPGAPALPEKVVVDGNIRLDDPHKTPAN